jgi:uncharacterized membrane protein YozB (DUF420 family)
MENRSDKLEYNQKLLLVRFIFYWKDNDMLTFLNGDGFLGTSAPLHSDLALIMILISAILFTVGWRLAIGKHYKAHRWVQTTAALVNASVVITVMVTSFFTHILPGIPGKLLEGDYGFTTFHALVGTAGLLLGMFVVLRANGLAPRPLRFNNYKLFMRTAYLLYMLSTLLGVIVYGLVYIYHI